MRILVATDQWFPDQMGGVARFAADTARGWAARGHDVVVLAPRRDGSETQVQDGLTLLRVLSRGRLPQTLTDTYTTRRAASRLVAGAFDVLVSHSVTTTSGLVSAGIDAPLVHVFHASAADEARDFRARRGLGRDWLSAALLERPLRRLTLDALRRATSIVVLSEFSRGLVHQLSPGAADRVTLVPGAVDTNAFSPQDREQARSRLGLTASTRLVLTVRRIEPRMGLGNLVKASRLVRDVPDIRIAIAGSGPPQAVKGLQSMLRADDNVSLLGRVPDEELRLWHRAADLFVLPTLAYEGFGLVTVEALASGTPVVGTPVGATPEILAPLDPRLIARGTDPASLADAIRMGLGLGTSAFRQRCCDYARARFSLDAALAEWERVLGEAVARHEVGASAGLWVEAKT